jgi:hypothetical protein
MTQLLSMIDDVLYMNLPVSIAAILIGARVTLKTPI